MGYEMGYYYRVIEHFVSSSDKLLKQDVSKQAASLKASCCVEADVHLYDQKECYRRCTDERITVKKDVIL